MIRVATALLLLPFAGIFLKIAQPAAPEFDRSKGVKLAEQMLETNGLEQDLTSNIAISGQKAAVVFASSSGCKGALVVVPLPPTAQRFDTIVTGLDYAVAAEGFVFRGQHSDSYPYRRLLLHRLGHALYLPGSDHNAWASTVFAYRELGHCGIAPKLDWNLVT